LATTNDNGPELLDVPLGVPVDENGVTCWYFARQTRFYTYSRPFRRWLGRHLRHYDLVHIHALFSYCSNAAALLAAREGIPYIIRPLGVLNEWGMRNRRPWLKKLSFRFVESRVLANAAFVHYTSEQERLEAAALGLSHRALIIPNPAEPPSAAPRRLAGRFRSRHPRFAERKLVLFLSRIDRKKGLDLLLPAFARLKVREPMAALVIAGDGDARLTHGLQAEARRLGVAEDILWTGLLSGVDKAAAFVDADVFVLPSYSENFGVAVIEAMTYGTPVVVSDQVAIHPQIRQARAGVVVPCQADALASALSWLLGDPQTRRELAENGKRLVTERFTVDAVARQLIAAYGEIARARPVDVAKPGKAQYQEIHNE
jgi:glycosyltransferase involved in cell wall biosynthesis